MATRAWKRNPVSSVPHESWTTDPDLASILTTADPQTVTHWTDVAAPWTVAQFLLVPMWATEDSGEFRLYSLVQQRSVLSIRDITTGWNWLASDPAFTKDSITEVQGRLLAELANNELP